MAVQATPNNRGVIHFKTQSSLGYSAPVYGTEKAVQCETVELEVIGEPDILREGEFDAVPGGLAPLLGRRAWRVGFTAKLSSWGATNSATDHELAAFFAGCPMAITAGAGDGDDLDIDPVNASNLFTTYSPFSVLVDHINGNKYEIKDAVGRVVRIYADGAGAPVMIEGEIMGLWQSTPSATSATFTNADFTAQAPLMNKGATLSENIGTVYGFGAWEFIPGHVLQEVPDATDANGMSVFYAGHEGNAIFRWNINSTTEAADGVWTEWLAQTGAGGNAWSVTLGAAGSQLILSMPNGYMTVPQFAEGNGVRKWQLEIRGRSTIATLSPQVDHYQITFS